MSFKFYRKLEKFPEKIFNINTKFLLGIILLLAFLIRVLFLNIDSMWIDETISANSAKGILETGSPTLESGDLYNRALIFHYIMAFFIFIFKGDFGARFVSVFFGVLTVYLAYLFAKKFSKDKFMIFGFPLIIAISSIEIIYSRQARFYQFFQFFYFLSFYLYYRIYLEKDFFIMNKYVSIIALLTATLITISTHKFGYVLIPLYVFGLIIYKMKNPLKWKNKKNVLYLSFLLLLFGAVLMYIYLFLNFNTFIQLDNFSKIAYYSFLYYDFFDTNLLIIIISLLGLIYSLFHNFKENIIISSFIIIPAIGLLFVKFFASRYSYFLFFILFYYFIYALSLIRFRMYALVFLIIVHIGVGFSFSPIIYPNYDFTMPTADYKGAYDFLSNGDFKEKDIVMTWGPAMTWYFDNKYDQDIYWIKYSIDGTSSNWAISSKTNKEKFSNANIIYSIADMPSSSIVVLDLQAANKIGPTYNLYLVEYCYNIYSSYNIDILNCNSNFKSNIIS